MLSDFEKERFSELHRVILEDDGYPKLFDKYKEIMFDITKIDIQNYQGPKVKEENPKYDIITNPDRSIPY